MVNQAGPEKNNGARSSGAAIMAAIGNFDGVHIGHQHLLSQVVDASEKAGLMPAVVLFDPHPRRYFKPDDPAFLLTSPERRDALLQSYGIEIINTLPFNSEFSSLSAEVFIKDILCNALGVKGIIVGDDFRFGKGREGDIKMLRSIGNKLGMSVDHANILKISDKKIGSSAIRSALQSGDVKSAASMLGRSWEVSGKVLSGQKLGRTIGFPTANMQLGDLIAPKLGVYALQIDIDGNAHHGVGNFGRKPTIGLMDPLLEVHLFDFDADIYGKTINVEFIDFIREERKFDGLEALKAQISKDCDQVRALFG